MSRSVFDVLFLRRICPVGFVAFSHQALERSDWEEATGRAPSVRRLQERQHAVPHRKASHSQLGVHQDLNTAGVGTAST